MPTSILSSTVDGMDAAKFRLPRCVDAFKSKSFGSAWRPQLHVSGMLLDGLGELFILADSDIKKGGNLQATILSRGLTLAHKWLVEKGIQMPSNWRVHSDNAASEQKNQTIMKFAAYLVWTKKTKALN